jgi:hypothetical protein
VPQRISFTRGAWIAFAAFALLQVGLLGVQVAIVEDQRSTTDDQLRTAVRQANRAIPLMESVKPLVGDARDAAPALQKLNRETLELTDALTPLAQNLNNARADEQLRAAGALARALLRSDVESAVVATRRIASTLDDTELPRTTRQLRTFLDSSLRIQQETLAIQREAIALQRQALAVAQQTLETARETERHAESVDRKTGGSPPVPTGTTGP